MNRVVMKKGVTKDGKSDETRIVVGPGGIIRT